MALTPEEQAEMAALEEEIKATDLGAMINPDLDPVPQALSTLPNTNHPGGESGAEAAWMRKPGGESKGVVFAYEPTLLAVQNRLANDQAFNSAVFPSMPLTPERIARMTRKDSEYQAAATKIWQETADAAAGAGKTAYRYAYTPYLQGAKEMGALQMLKGGLNPASETAQAFIMGADDTALFGAVRGAGESEKQNVQGTASALGIEHTGGVQPGANVEYNAEVQAEHPVAFGVGQAAGLLNPISLGGMLMSTLGKAGMKLASKSPGLFGLGTRVAAAGGGAAAGAGAHRAVSEGVDAASNLSRTGDTGTTLAEAGGRVQAAATDPPNILMGSGGELAGAALGAAGRGVAGSGRFKGRIERVEQLGGDVKFLKGPTAPGADEAIAAGKARDVSPDQPIAERIAPEMVAAVKQRHESVKQEIKGAQETYYPTREGQLRLPVTETLEETKRAILKPQTLNDRGQLEIVDRQARARDVKANRTFFNDQVADVSLKPSEGAVELSRKEAAAVLAEHWLRKVPGDGPIYVAPKRYTAEAHEELIRGRQMLEKDPQKPGARQAKQIYEASYRDRDKRPLDGVEGGWSAMQRKHHELLLAAEEEMGLVAPGGNALSAQQELSKYARQSAGELPRVNAIEGVGKRAGVGDELRLMRVLDPLGALKEQGALHKPAHAAPPTTLYGALSSAAEGMTLRGLYPGLKAAGGANSPLRGGRAGRAGLVDVRGTSLDDEKEKRP